MYVGTTVYVKFWLDKSVDRSTDMSAVLHTRRLVHSTRWRLVDMGRHDCSMPVVYSTLGLKLGAIAITSVLNPCSSSEKKSRFRPGEERLGGAVTGSGAVAPCRGLSGPSLAN